VVVGPRSGSMPSVQSFCAVDKDNVLITTLKRAEDGEDIVVRLLETAGVETVVGVDLPFAGFARAVETNLVEQGARPLEGEGTHFRIRLEPWRVATVRLVRDPVRIPTELGRLAEVVPVDLNDNQRAVPRASASRQARGFAEPGWFLDLRRLPVEHQWIQIDARRLIAVAPQVPGDGAMDDSQR